MNVEYASSFESLVYWTNDVTLTQQQFLAIQKH